MPAAKQATIGTVLSNIDAELAAIKVKIVKAHQIKAGMMQESLTEKIRQTSRDRQS